MDSEIKISNKEWTEAKTQIQQNCDQFAFVKDLLNEIKQALLSLQTQFATYRSDLGDTVAKMTGVFDKRCDALEKAQEKLESRLNIYKATMIGGWVVFMAVVGIFVWLVDHYKIFTP